MTTVKRAVTLDEDLERQARELSGGNFSAFVNEALARQVRAAKLDRLVHADETERGAVPADVQQQVDDEIAALDAQEDPQRLRRVAEELAELGVTVSDLASATHIKNDLLATLRERLTERVQVHGNSPDELVGNANQALADAVKRVAHQHRQVGVNILVLHDTDVTAEVIGRLDAPDGE